MSIGQEFLYTPVAAFQVFDDGVHFDAVTCGEQQSLAHTRVRTETTERFAETAFRNGELLTNLDRSGLVAQPDNNDMHQDTEP
jgi:hypothetical protein